MQYCIGGAGDESLGLWEKNTRGKFQKLWCCIDKDIKKCTKCIVELYKHTGILKNIERSAEKNEPKVSVSHTSCYCELHELIPMT